MSVRELKAGEFLYQRGDPSPVFYFMLKGKVEIISATGEGAEQTFKFNKNCDEFEFFGLRQSSSDTRGDHARAVGDCLVVQISKDHYEQIVKKTQLSVSEQKIDFLMRYVPKLRAVSRTMIEDLEIFFQKEVATQGYIL
jgi:CRP-like cAMP-binding protein